MTIRPATEADLPRILEMGARFHACTSYAPLGFDPVMAEQVARILLDTGVLLVADVDGLVGMVGLAVTPHLFNAAALTAHEVMWWVEPEHRATGAGVALLRAVEPACREKGVQAIQMMRMADSPPQAQMLYERMGYVHTESSFTRAL